MLYLTDGLTIIFYLLLILQEGLKDGLTYRIIDIRLELKLQCSLILVITAVLSSHAILRRASHSSMHLYSLLLCPAIACIVGCCAPPPDDL